MKASQLKFVRTASIAAAIVAVGSFGQVYAQETAPPVGDAAPPVSDTAPPATTDNSTSPTAAPTDSPSPDANVFNWQDVPTNQQIVIDRAVFDEGGYQLYCHTGETIVIPFANQNLYVMKFGRSDSGAYFVNDGTTPTLYVPQGGYLENAAAANAKWYPFPDDYDYSQPVYEGVAPSWDAYVNMAWYPDMECYGGYWGYHAYAAGVVFSPLPGFCISIFDQPYYGWNSYRSYYIGHPESRVYFRAASTFHYNKFPARGAAYFGNRLPFVNPNVGRSQGVGGRPTQVFGRSTTDGHFGTTRVGNTDTSRVVTPASAHVWGGTTPATAPAHVWGSATPTARAPFSGSTAGGSATTARAPFGGATYASPYQGGTTRGTVVNGTAHNWGTGTSSTSWGSGNSTYGSSNTWRSTSSTGASGHVWTSGSTGGSTVSSPRPATPTNNGGK